MRFEYGSTAIELELVQVAVQRWSRRLRRRQLILVPGRRPARARLGKNPSFAEDALEQEFAGATARLAAWYAPEDAGIVQHEQVAGRSSEARSSKRRSRSAPVNPSSAAAARAALRQRPAGDQPCGSG
jgi:hypothetical protein